jgi:ferredoxin
MQRPQDGPGKVDEMAHVVTGRCVDCKYTDCCTVCPVDCFWEIENPRMLVIDPDTCIDCQLCVPECPINAIYEESETPEPYQEWIAKNRDLFAQGHVITTKKDPLPGAKSLEQLQEDEKQRGWSVQEPRNA